MNESSYLRMCRSCGADFAKTVTACPHCGKKVQSGTLLMLIIGLGCLAVVAAFALPINKGQSDDMKIISEASVDQINAASAEIQFGDHGIHEPFQQHVQRQPFGYETSKVG